MNLNKSLKKVVVLTISSSLFFSGCSSAASAGASALPIAPQVAIPVLIGSVGGAGFGHLFGKENGDATQNVLINSAIGAGVGLAAGAVLYTRQLELKQEQEETKKQGELIVKSQKDIDTLRTQVNESSSWGRNETKSFEERYQIDRSEEPYQGN
jgi:hypothetical protein